MNVGLDAGAVELAFAAEPAQRRFQPLRTAVAPGQGATFVIYLPHTQDDTLGSHGVLEPGITLLGKPFTPNALLRKIHEILTPDRP